MDPSRPDRILRDWDAVTSETHPPAAPPRRIVTRSRLSGASLAGAGLVVVALGITIVWLGRPGGNGGVGGIPSTSPSPSAAPLATPSADPSARLPTPAPAPAAGPCEPATLAARIILWEGAAGHRIADVELTNGGSSSCTVMATSKLELVDGSGSILIDASIPPASALVTVTPGGVLTTLVDTSNYCGPAPVAPVTVAFALDDGRLVATPASATDLTVPPCLGLPGSAGEIQMQPWAP
jgi:hypothetical protein